MIGGVVEALRSEAQATNERRMLVLSGTASETSDAVAEAIEAMNVTDDVVTVVGRDSGFPGEHLSTVHADRLLGRTRDVVVLDCTARCDPNALGQAVGAVDGGGLFVLLAPSLSSWPDRRDDFDASLAVPPFEVSAVSGNFRRRLLETLRTHPGIAIVDVSDNTIVRNGLTNPHPRRRRSAPTIPAEIDFPRKAYDTCLTDDQVQALLAFEHLQNGGQAVVVEADRGRGKSSAVGLAAGSLAQDGRDVLVTAPEYRAASEVFVRARELRNSLEGAIEVDREEQPREIFAETGSIRFLEPTVAAEQAGTGDVLFVDEAASLPVGLLEAYLEAPAVAFTTTIRGYEGTGRGFEIRFRDRLAETDFDVTEQAMSEPIRYAAGDPIETWAFRALLLDASPPVEQLVTEATPENVTYRRLEAKGLLEDEPLLREVFGLLVVAHYRTEPSDLARLLDAPNVSIRALTHDGHVVSVALLAQEGNLPADLRSDMYEGGRIAGNMLPDVLTTQLRDEDAGEPVGQRVMRIATHHAVRNRGLGSHLLAKIESEFAEDVDWLGSGYGVTPRLVDFWVGNGYHAVHLSTSRNDRSGEHSAIMLMPTSPNGRALFDHHTDWFLDRIGGMLTDPLDALDPDVVRTVLRSIDGEPVLDLTVPEWRVLAGSPHGAGLYDTAPEAFARLALRHLVALAETSLLSNRQERLLVAKSLQRRSWDEVTEELGFHSRRECMRAVGAAIERLVDEYGGELARSERERFERSD